MATTGEVRIEYAATVGVQEEEKDLELEPMIVVGSRARKGSREKRDDASEEEEKSVLRKPKSPWVRFLVWLRGLKQVFGLPFLFLVGTVYWVQGFKSFSSLAVNYLYKDELKLQPAESQALTTTMYIPWGIKPLYGILSDSLPIRKYHRRSYLSIMGLISFFSYLALSVRSFTSTATSTTVFLLLTNLATAFNDVVIDARVVEMSRLDPENGANNLQSLSWCMMALGGIVGSLLAGPVTDHLGPRTVFLFSAFGPILIIILAVYMKEEQSEVNHGIRGCVVMAKGQVKLLKKAFDIPLVRKSALWIFLSGAMSPSFGQISFYYATDVLSFTPEFLGTISAFGYVFLMIGTILYNVFMKRMKFRKILCIAQVSLAIVSLLDIILVTRANLALGIPDKVFVMGDEVVSDVVARMKTMPVLVLASKICPKGAEGTMFALLMSISNFSSSVGSYSGAAICSLIGISRNHYVNLWLAVLIRSVLKICPVFFLFLIPDTEQQAVVLAEEA